MLFYLILFCFLNVLYKSFGLIQIEFDVKSECSVRLETDKGVEICLNHKCSDFKDPWRVINSHIQDKPCYLHYLRLSFTTYDQLLIFIEIQHASDNSLDSFFATDETKHTLLEIEINKIYPLNENYFLTEDMLNKLGGRTGKISLLQIEILNWYNSPRTMVQTIENDIVDRQPFQQITILYQCLLRSSMERLVLAKYLIYQERSTCPSQINVTRGEDLLLSSKSQSTEYIKYNPMNTFQYDYFNKVKSLYEPLNSSNHTSDENSHQWNSLTKIIIIFIIIIIVIIFMIYQHYCSKSMNTRE